MADILQAASYRFAMEIHSPTGDQIESVTLERPDFDRAIEATYFAALQKGKLNEYQFDHAAARILPRLRSGTNSAGFEIVTDTPSGEERRRFGLNYFKTQARRHGARLVVGGHLPEEATVVYRLTAVPKVQETRPRGWALELDAEPARIEIRKGDLARHQMQRWDGVGQDDFRVLVPRHVIDEALQEACRVPDREVGGVLLGHLFRDGDSRELYLEVSCLVPCEQTKATAISVTFTHDTWARVREVAEIRGEGELIVGWVHSHPFRLCAECPSPVPLECQKKVLFYSTDDDFLMELTFPRPFMVGLLAAVETRLESALSHPPVKLFGWRDGVIVPRGFDVIE